jgi:PiT family inorganic phosphate transporter
LDISVWFFISSGLFLGWSLGANNAVSLFGTAVTSKMIKFRTAAIISGIFVVLGSFISGAGTTSTLTDLGGINAIAGSFTVALSVAISVTWMTRASLPVSTSQAVVGAIIGWNIFTGSPTDINSLTKIVSSWVVSPVIAGIFGFIIFKIVKNTVLKWKIHMLEIDTYTRTGLIIVGAMASYSMGANNIANVMGMFASASPFNELMVLDFYSISGIQQLFLLGGLSIAVGIFTYGNKVMKTVGTDLYKISPITGFVIVLAGALVLWLFTSQSLETFLLENGLPAIPLVPLSATQSFIGAVIGVGLAKDPQSINFKVFGKIGLGWLVAPITAGILAYVLLFFVQNVFEQKIIQHVPYEISESVVEQLNKDGIETEKISDLVNKRFLQNKIFRYELLKRYPYNTEQLYSIFHYAIIDSFRIDSMLLLQSVSYNQFSYDQIEEIKRLHGKSFNHKIEFDEAVFYDNEQWGLNGARLRDKGIKEKKIIIENLFRVSSKDKNKSDRH